MRSALAVFFCCAALGCSTQSLELPSITDIPSGLRFEGKIVWHDLVTHTLPESKRFYAELFGWEYQDLRISTLAGEVDYALITLDGELVGGMVDANGLERPDPSAGSRWIVAMSVGNLDAAASEVAASGGRILVSPTDAADRGRLALVEDSEGAVLVLLQSRDGDPRDADAPAGTFLWDELWADDVERASRFYSELAELAVQDAAAGDGSYRFLSSGRQPRIGILANPAPGFDPTWVSYLRVADSAAVAGRVPGLGGEVLVPVQARPVGGTTALIAGPSGAGIALQSLQPLDE